MSLLNWRTGVFGEVYAGSGGLLGIYTQKNMLGQNAMFVLLAGVALLLVGAWRSLFLCLVLAVGMGIAAISLQLSQSVTPMLVLPIAVGLLLVLCVRRLDARVVVLAGLVLFVALAAGPIYLAVAGVNPIDEVLGAFGKNSTLTGRTRIWSFGLVVLQDYWGLGVGFLAFWRSAEFSSYATIIQAIGGENVRAFHNFILEVWIGTGIPGVVTMLVLLWAALWRTWTAYRATDSVSAAFAFVVVVTSILLCLPGTGLYRQHESLLMFVVMFGASAAASVRQPRRAGQA
jgi:O-antigen ligase